MTRFQCEVEFRGRAGLRIEPNREVYDESKNTLKDESAARPFGHNPYEA